MTPLLSYFFITMTEPDLENISLSYMLNRLGVSYYTECQWQVSCSWLWELLSPIEIQLSQKRKNFPNFSFHFWNLHQILNILKKNMIFIATLFRKLLTVRDLVTTLSKKHRSRTPFDSQHVKGSKGRVKSAWKNFYHILSSLCEKLIWKICPWWYVKS